MIATASDKDVLRFTDRRLFERVARERQQRAYEPRLAAYRAMYPQDAVRVLTPQLMEQRVRQAFERPDLFHWIEGIPFPALAGGAANTSPIFPLAVNIAFATMSAANTATDGTGTVNALITGGTNGSRIDRILLLPMGNNVATKCYLFLNNGGTNATAANNALLRDIPLAAGTGSNTALIGSPVEITLSLPIKSAWILNATLATAVATGWKIICIAGDY